jgi:hypothetical protein
MIRTIALNTLLMVIVQVVFVGESVALSDDSSYKHYKIGSTDVDLGGEYRIRGEYDNHFNIKIYAPENDDDFVLSRFRFNINTAFSSAFKTIFQFQDARVFGSAFEDDDFAQSNPFHDNMDIRQAYIVYNTPYNLAFKIGRQEIAFRDNRIFGPGNWGNTGRYVWDAARLQYSNSSIESHTLWGRYIINDPDQWPNKHADGPTAYANYTMIKNLPFDFDWFYVIKSDSHGETIGESGPGNLSCHSTGFAVNGALKQWDYGMTTVYQFGDRGRDNISAYGLATRLGYTFGIPWTPHVMVQFINGSGDKNPNDGRSGTFDGVFSGADTVLYGWMNLFFWSNTREYRMDTILSPTKKFSFRGEYHYFTLDEEKDAWYYPGKAQRRDSTGNSGRELGHEVDLTFRWQPLDWLDILGGYCMFFPGEFIQNTGPSPDATWTFLQTVFSF